MASVKTVVDVPAQSTALVSWMVAPEAPPQPRLGLDVEERRRDEDATKARWWSLAYEKFLKSCSPTNSPQTSRAYRKSIEAFQAFIGATPMWRVIGSHVIAWQTTMRDAGLAETTINLRLSALSALYDFLSSKFPYPDPRTGDETFLIGRNPVACATRAKIDPYANSDSLSVEEAQALLRRGPDRASVVGLRDFCLIHLYMYTGCRVSEILRLTWGDLIVSGDKVFYKWMGKGNKRGTFELPRPSHDAILAYLRAAGRLETITDSDVLFPALSDAAARLPNVGHADRSKPITSAMFGRILKKCAKRVGLDPARVHPHLLRHTAADLMIEASEGDYGAVQEFLHHSSLAITQIYIQRRKKTPNPHWIKINTLLGI